jgi:translation elongation factor EF-Tu-like GTPase
MIVSDEKFDEVEREIEELLASLDFEMESSPLRIDSIMKRVKVEALLRESTDFVTEGMGKGLKGLTDTLTKLVKKDPEPPKRSY